MVPYLIALCNIVGEDTTRHLKGRSVAFPVSAIDKERTLFATCKHVFMGAEGMIFIDREGSQITYPSEMDFFFSPRSDLDLAFFVVKQIIRSESRRMNEKPIKEGTLISHARNTFLPDMTSDTFLISSHTTRRADFKAWLGLDTKGDLMYDFLREKKDLVKAKAEGATLYNVLEMQSFPGASGSPLWDEYGAIRGMVCGGNSNEDVLEDNIFRLVYLPIQTILREAKRALNALKAGATLRL